MAKSIQSKAKAPSTPVVAVALPVALERIAHELSGAIQESTSLSVTLGNLTIKAAKHVKAETLDPFVDACKQLCESAGLTEGSFKTYLSNIRGVLRAMLDGYKPKPGESLRTMYNAAPKGKGRQKAGARTPTGKADIADDGDDGDVVTLAPAEAKKLDKNAAITLLFGTCNPELMAAVDYAVSHSGLFMSWAGASVKAAQLAEMEKLAGQKVVPVVPVKAPAKAPRKVKLAKAA